MHWTGGAAPKCSAPGSKKKRPLPGLAGETVSMQMMPWQHLDQLNCDLAGSKMAN
jgi:hypothetical protein